MKRSANVLAASANGYSDIAAYVRERGFEVSHEVPEGLRPEQVGLIVTGEKEALMLLLTDLRYGFPIEYVSGWTMP